MPRVDHVPIYKSSYAYCKGLGEKAKEIQGQLEQPEGETRSVRKARDEAETEDDEARAEKPQGKMVGVARFELTTLCSQSRCATNCATRRNSELLIAKPTREP
jgi:hypothetical protein